MNYENKTDLNLKTYLSIVEINNDLLLIYRGYLLRGHGRDVVVLHKERNCFKM